MFVVGVSSARCFKKSARDAASLASDALSEALADANQHSSSSSSSSSSVEGAVRVTRASVRALLVCGSVQHAFMPAHALAARLELRADTLCKTIDVGGATPGALLIEAQRLLRNGDEGGTDDGASDGASVVAIVCADACGSMGQQRFAEAVLSGLSEGDVMPTAVYDRLTDAYMRSTGESRERVRRDLASACALMTAQAARHEGAIVRRALSVDEVLASGLAPGAQSITRAESAQRADGAAVVLVATERVARALQGSAGTLVEVVAVAEASASVASMLPADTTSEPRATASACKRAAEAALRAAGHPKIDYFALYDCFPVALLRALEEVGACEPRGAGAYVRASLDAITRAPGTAVVPLNTHGGLMGHGAPWYVPALMALVEAVDQVRGRCAAPRQVPGATTALWYANGGALSHAAVAVLRARPCSVRVSHAPRAWPTLPPTRLTALLGCRYPIMVAGMAGVTRAELAAAVSRAGGFGTLGMSYFSPDEIRSECARCAELCGGAPFGGNLIVHQPDKYVERVRAMIEGGVRLFVGGLGIRKEIVDLCHAHNVLVGCVCGRVAHAEHAVSVGCDLVIAQGSGGGGHTGDIALVSLLPLVIDAVGSKVPVVAAGGLYDWRGVAATVYAMGAGAVWMGTRFLASEEASLVPGYRETLLSLPRDAPTVVTRAYTGKPCRVLRTTWVDEYERAGSPRRPFDESVALSIGSGANHLHVGRDVNPADVDIKREFMPCGQGAPGIEAVLPAEAIVHELVTGVARWLRERPSASL